MSSYREYRGTNGDIVITADVTNINLNDIGAADTFTLTPTRVDTNTAGSATGAITYNATEATLTSSIQTAIRALGGIYADATVANGTTAAHKNITVNGGYDVTWAVTNATGFTPGATTETTPGSYKRTFKIPAPEKFVAVRLRVEDLDDASVDFTVEDKDGKDIYVKTGLSVAAAFDDFLAVDGVDDAGAAAEVGPGLFKGPVTAAVTTSAPKTPTVMLICEVPFQKKKWLRRSTGAVGNSTTTLHLGSTFVKIARIDILASADSSADYSIIDEYGKTVYAKTALDATTELRHDVKTDTVLQDGTDSARGDLGDLVVRSPVDVVIANVGTGTARVALEVIT